MMKPVVFREASKPGLCVFSKPCRLIEACHINEVIPDLKLVETLVEEQGLYAAGFIGYEAAPAFDSALAVHPPGDFPLLWFGLYEEMQRIEEPGAGSLPSLPCMDWRPSVDPATYRRRIDDIKSCLAQGET
ncbi:MAG: aminodeoxychorismate synthase, component I, partial [Deltaproteobacteria bacterium]|nr:aminodeoxychorismate synthase, component I [Deltaproteobacteria bacterium]